MIPYARLTPGPDFQWRRACLYYAQRIAIYHSIRRAVSFVVATIIRLKEGRVRCTPKPWHSAVVSEIRKTGVSVIPGFVSQEKATRMQAFFANRAVHLPKGPIVPFSQIPPGTSLVSLPLATIRECADLVELISSPDILKLA